MKRSAKTIDIKNPEVIFPFVAECIFRHYKRYSFKALLLKIGKMPEEEYKACVANSDKEALVPYIKNICVEAAKRIAERDLKLPPCHIRERKDHTTDKIRQIGEESAMQQCFDYIAVRSCNEIWKRRLALQQVSSIKGRGQIMGIKMIRSWAIKDKTAAAYARAHGQRYSRKMKLFAKLDVKLCYPSYRLAVFMALFRRDCGNADILWLWEDLLKRHLVDGNEGFMIGSLVSQWAAQYLLSFTWHYAMSLSYTRRGKRMRHITHGLLFMDDMLYTGSNRQKLRMALEDISDFTLQKTGLNIKPLWQIHLFADVGIDMMGFVVHQNGKITIRGRDFIRVRRCIIRYNARGRYTLKPARRACTFKGIVKHSDSRKFQETYGTAKAFKAAASVVSRHDRKRSKDHGKSLF